MTRRLIVRPAAESDITEAALWYESRESGPGLKVISEIRAQTFARMIDGMCFDEVDAKKYPNENF